eukprot:651249-Prorocentrum_minimum.AAC.1
MCGVIVTPPVAHIPESATIARESTPITEKTRGRNAPQRTQSRITHPDAPPQRQTGLEKAGYVSALTTFYSPYLTLIRVDTLTFFTTALSPARSATPPDIFSQRTNRTQEARVYSHDGPIVPARSRAPEAAPPPASASAPPAGPARLAAPCTAPSHWPASRSPFPPPPAAPPPQTPVPPPAAAPPKKQKTA